MEIESLSPLTLSKKEKKCRLFKQIVFILYFPEMLLLMLTVTVTVNVTVTVIECQGVSPGKLKIRSPLPNSAIKKKSEVRVPPVLF